MVNKIEYKYTKIEIITLFMLIMLTVMAYVIVSGSYIHNNLLEGITNILLIMIFGILLTMNISIMKILSYLRKKVKRG